MRAEFGAGNGVELGTEFFGILKFTFSTLSIFSTCSHYRVVCSPVST
jgi:hypothetical protein